MALLERGELEFGAQAGALRLRLLAHHAGPVHLSHADLASLGLALAAAAEGLAPSAVLAPGPEEPEGTEGTEVGGFLLSPVREGLDVFVQESDAGPVLASRAVLARLGIFSAPRGGEAA